MPMNNKLSQWGVVLCLRVPGVTQYPGYPGCVFKRGGCFISVVDNWTMEEGSVTGRLALVLLRGLPLRLSKRRESRASEAARPIKQSV